jgi:hypothetical protein
LSHARCLPTIANIVRSGIEWTDNELEAYNIEFTFQDAPTFFGETPLPLPTVNQEVLTALTADDTAYNLLTQLNLAMMPSEPEESAVAVFPWLYPSPSSCSHAERVTVHYMRGEQGCQTQHLHHRSKCQNHNSRRRSVGLEAWDSKVSTH